LLHNDSFSTRSVVAPPSPPPRFFFVHLCKKKTNPSHFFTLFHSLWQWGDPFDAGDCPANCRDESLQCQWDSHCGVGEYCGADYTCTKCSQCSELNNGIWEWPCSDRCDLFPKTTIASTTGKSSLKFGGVAASAVKLIVFVVGSWFPPIAQACLCESVVMLPLTNLYD